MLDHPEWQRAQRGELYHAFVPELIAARDRCKQACNKLNSSAWITRRRAIELWREITNDTRSLPPQQASLVEDKLFEKEPSVVGLIHADYGFNIVLGKGAQLNLNSSFVDTCPIRIGARTLVAPNCSFSSGTHPLDPALKNRTNGPELGKKINVGEDCWLGRNVIILPGVTIGPGCTVGAASVVTKGIPGFHAAAGNPARILRKIQTPMDPTQDISRPPKQEREQGAEGVTTE
ncbi:uncharacterized protein Z519_03235 [Cladophialophora bantiana CBS 173.52]|uniref:Maltose/galactoside acetyltransferase domain-containing protein n=1 Tax=Cladophialophora bantiana (strain ATCC 10958 / CBS 173.52 / CDC B-1940 / NIH 8579) TaxID=1442370 RepID=A0A0D2HRQ1_CLAB1|nr:uncharacterized protein Z519_03235 [Cladophialophora bantiana CBS 173.52]KIW96168.1 hypothetical protein Z519_03235 [Cladophialophora bantiana CBS 173.52]